jgi:hypothetical protein
LISYIEKARSRRSFGSPRISRNKLNEIRRFLLLIVKAIAVRNSLKSTMPEKEKDFIRSFR